MFSNDFFQNAIFIFTHWSYDERNERFRANGRVKSKEAYINEFISILNRKFAVKVDLTQFIFIDNSYSGNKD